MDPIVVCKLGKRKPFGPVVLTVAYKHTQVLFNLLVDALRLTISLWVEGSRGTTFYAKKPVQILRKPLHKLGATITNDLGW